jgi:hypothetical protein
MTKKHVTAKSARQGGRVTCVHVTETCEKESPHLITHVATTAATTTDEAMTETIHAELEQTDLTPCQHLLDSGYITAPILVSSQQHYGILRDWTRASGCAHGKPTPMTASMSVSFALIGTNSKRLVPKGIRVSNGRQAAMSRAIRSFVSGLTGAPVAPVPPAGCAPPRKTLHGNSPSGHKSTTRPSRRHGSARRRRSSKRSTRCGRGWRALSHKEYGVLISARVATLG